MSSTRNETRHIFEDSSGNQTILNIADPLNKDNDDNDSAYQPSFSDESDDDSILTGFFNDDFSSGSNNPPDSPFSPDGDQYFLSNQNLDCPPLGPPSFCSASHRPKSYTGNVGTIVIANSFHHPRHSSVR